MFCLLIAGAANAEDLSNHELNERLKKLEEKMGTGGTGRNWTDRITLSGAIEAEAAFESVETIGDDTDTSDITLSKVDVNIDVDIVRHVSGHVVFTYSGEDDQGMEVDEGFITLGGRDVTFLYLMAGKIYVPFGHYATHMITDPLTRDLGETVEGAVQVGYASEWIDTGIALFQGEAEIDDEDNDDIADYVLSLKFNLPEGVAADINLSAGLSYLSNIGDTDRMVEEIVGTMDDKVAGMGAFISASFKNFIFMEAEYITALDDINDDITPTAWNLETAIVPMENLEMAFHYGHSEETENHLPKTRYGLTGTYHLFESTTAALEYLKNEYDNDNEAYVITAQLAIEF
jgi:hypothetical protein